MNALGPESEYIDGWVAYKHGDYKTAFELWTKAARRGVAEAQFSLGGMYDRGEGVPQDYNQALSWFREAADQGNADAQFNLGLMYGKGSGVPRDDTQSLFWFRKAANQGDSNAQFVLGLIYETAKGLAQDYDQAVLWYKKAAVKGNSKAQINLGFLYHSGRGVTQDNVEALKWFMLAPACESDEGTRDKAIKSLDLVAKELTSEQAAEAQRRAVDDPMFDPCPAYIISRLTEWRKEREIILHKLSQTYSAKSKDTERGLKPETYDDIAKDEIVKSFRETVTFHGLHSKYEATMWRLSRFLDENVLVENSKLPKVAWWQKLKNLFEIEESFHKQTREAFAANNFENYEIYSGLAKEALQQICDSVEKADAVGKPATEKEDRPHLPKVSWWQKVKSLFSLSSG